jgi:Zn-dependent membrane protease YugP
MYFDPIYFAFIAPALLLSLWASCMTKHNFSKYSKVAALSGLTGAQAAQRLLEGAGIANVSINATRGILSDHYNPLDKSLNLSETVYGSRSVAAIGVACHEAGHAIQHAVGYKALGIARHWCDAKIGSTLGYFVMLGGLLLSSANVALVGAALFSAVLMFQIVTLPVEFDASNRAKALVSQYGIVTEREKEGMSKVLNAAALTYVAAAVSTLLTLLYFLFRAGLLGGGSRD